MNVLTKVKEMAPEATQFAWDGCHKIYILENQEEVTEAEKVGKKFYVDLDSVEWK